MIPTFGLCNVNVVCGITHLSSTFPVSGFNPEGTSTETTIAGALLIVSIAFEVGCLIFPLTPVPSIASIIIAVIFLNFQILEILN